MNVARSLRYLAQSSLLLLLCFVMAPAIAPSMPWPVRPVGADVIGLPSAVMLASMLWIRSRTLRWGAVIGVSLALRLPSGPLAQSLLLGASDVLFVLVTLWALEKYRFNRAIARLNDVLVLVASAMFASGLRTILVALALGDAWRTWNDVAIGWARYGLGYVGWTAAVTTLLLAMFDRHCDLDAPQDQPTWWRGTECVMLLVFAGCLGWIVFCSRTRALTYAYPLGSVIK